MKIIFTDEKIVVDDDSISAIARKSDGSMRDALSILDQVIAYAGESITIEDVSTVIGLIPNEIYFDFTDAIIEKVSSVKIVKALDDKLQFIEFYAPIWT